MRLRQKDILELHDLLRTTGRIGVDVVARFAMFLCPTRTLFGMSTSGAERRYSETSGKTQHPGAARAFCVKLKSSMHHRPTNV